MSPLRTVWFAAKVRLVLSTAGVIWIVVLAEKVVVLKFPSWNGLITKPDGARVIVATWLA